MIPTPPRGQTSLVSTFLVSMLFLLLPQAASADWAVNMPQGVTEISRSVFDLHMIIFWICTAIGVVVFGVMFWSMFKYRKSRGAKAANFHESTAVELAWTFVPLLILVAMAVPATTTLIDMYDTSDSEVDIKITGYQWKWKYDYLNEDISFFSNLSTPKEEIYNEVDKGQNYLLEVDNPMVVPVGKKIRFLITANDVIHSWWVPAFAVKKDAIPGFINETWTRIEEPGTYRGQCTELCGKDHGYMPVVVKAVPPEEYEEWVVAQQEIAAQEYELRNKEWTLEELMERGEAVYETSCAACHQLGGEGIPPTFPGLKGSAIATGPANDHIDVVVNGVKGTSMSAFGAQLSEVDLAAVITYERNAWGNDTGDWVSPMDIVEFRNQEQVEQSQ